MGSKVSDFVNVNITRQTAKISRVGFGTAMLLTEYYNIADRTKTYSDPSEMLTDGFVTTDAAYIAANELYSQEFTPSQFKVGRRKTNINDKQTITLDALATAGTFTVTVGAETTAGIAYDATAGTIETAIEALTGITSVTWTGTLDASLTCTIEFDGADANTEFSTISLDVSGLTGPTSATVSHTQWGAAEETYSSALTAVMADDNDWYALVAEARTQSDIEDLASLIEASDPPKIYGFSTDDSDVKNGVAANVLKTLKALSYEQTFYFFSSDTANYPEAAAFGYMLPKDPGSYTLRAKKLVGITPDTLTTDELNNIQDDNGNTFESVADNSIVTSDGVVVEGEYIDIIIGTDWLRVRLAEDIFVELIGSDKIPFTDAGTGQIEGAIRSRLSIAANEPHNLILEDSISVSVPKRSEVSVADRGNRYLSGCTFSAEYQGAIHKVGLTGKISV